jgi:hypothetical protein
MWAGALAFLLPLALYIATRAPDLTFIDSGELTAAAATLGIAHPTGYPLYTLLGRLLCALPGPLEPITRLTLLSAAAGAGAAALVYATGRRLLAELGLPRPAAIAGGLAAGLLLAAGQTVWEQSLIVEVYSLHLLLVALLVHLAHRATAARASGRTGADLVLLSFAAGLAIGMKPQFALVVLAAEAVAWRARRRAVPGLQLGALAATLAFAAAGTAWLAPDYLRVTLPLVWETYGAYHSPLRELVRWFDLPLAALLILIARLLPRGGALRDLARTLVVAAAAAYAAYLAAGTSWDYHRYPSSVFAIATLALPLLRPLSRGPVVGLLVLAVTGASLFVAPLEIRDPRRAGREWPGWTQGAATLEIVGAVERRGRGGPIFLFSSSVAPAFPAVNYANLEWASRFSCLWLLPAVVHARALPEGAIPEARRQRLDAIGRYLVDAVTDDLGRARPDLVFVPLRPRR